jgi:hypothetical protein
MLHLFGLSELQKIVVGALEEKPPTKLPCIAANAHKHVANTLPEISVADELQNIAASEPHPDANAIAATIANMDQAAINQAVAEATAEETMNVTLL